MENLYRPLKLFTVTLGKNLAMKENLDAISMEIERVRNQVRNEYGVVIPPVCIRESKSLFPLEYSIDVNEISVDKFTCEEKSALILDTGNVTKKISGKEVEEPAFKVPAQWISAEGVEEAIQNGYSVARYEKIIAVHLMEIIKRNLSSVITTQYVSDLIDEIEVDNKALAYSIRYEVDRDLVVDGLGGKCRINTVKKVLQSLLDCKVSIRNIIQILETICDCGDNASLREIIDNVREKILADIVAPLIEENILFYYEFSTELFNYMMEESESRYYDWNFHNVLRKVIDEKYAATENFVLMIPWTSSEDRNLFNYLYNLLKIYPDAHIIFLHEMFSVEKIFPSLELIALEIDFDIPKSISDKEPEKSSPQMPKDFSVQAEKCDILILNEEANIAVGVRYDAGRMKAPEIVVKSSEPDLLKAACKKAKIVTDRPVLASQLFEHGTEGKAVARDFFCSLAELFSEVQKS